MFSMFKLVEILRGEHPDWSGDRILNAETYCRNFYNENCEDSKKLAQIIVEDSERWSRELGISPDRLLWIANRLNGIA